MEGIVGRMTRQSDTDVSHIGAVHGQLPSTGYPETIQESLPSQNQNQHQNIRTAPDAPAGAAQEPQSQHQTAFPYIDISREKKTTTAENGVTFEQTDQRKSAVNGPGLMQRWTQADPSLQSWHAIGRVGKLDERNVAKQKKKKDGSSGASATGATHNSDAGGTKDKETCMPKGC